MNAITKFNHARPLTEEQLFAAAPSIFARTAHPSRSERFATIPTIDVVRGMAKEGFLPFRAAQSVARAADRRPYTKHMVRFRKVDRDDLIVGDSILEIVLVNGNDGSSIYRLDAGVFKIACLNGLITKSADYGSVKRRHTGDALSDVIDGTYEVLDNADKVLGSIEDWAKIRLGERARMALAHGAHVERFGEDEARITPEQLLIPRRAADTGKDLWTTFNVVQENVIAGGLVAPRRVGHRDRRQTTRPVNGIDQNVKLNKALWVMAEYLADRSDVSA